MRPSPAVRVFGTLAVQKLERKRDGSEFARWCVDGEINIVPPPRAAMLRFVPRNPHFHKEKA